MRSLKHLSWWRTALALAAAHVLALQMVLTGIVATTMALPAASADRVLICIGNPAGPSSHDDGGSPVTMQFCAVCAFAAHAAALPITPDVSPATTTFITVAAQIAPRAVAPLRRQEPRTSQGPPVIA